MTMQQPTLISLLSQAAISLLLLAILLPVISCSSPFQNRTRRSSSDPHCAAVSEVITLNFDGCEPVTTTISHCRGFCRSQTESILESPYNIQNCQCCRPAAGEIPVKVKKVWPVCGPEREEQLRRAWIPRIKNCECVPCSGSF